MFKKIIDIFFLIGISSFVFLTINFYLSKENISKITQIRSNYLYDMERKNYDLPLLKNDTINIIEYKESVKNSTTNRKKRKFEELLE